MSPITYSGFHARLPILRQRKNYIRKCRKKASQKKGVFAERASSCVVPPFASGNASGHPCGDFRVQPGHIFTAKTHLRRKFPLQGYVAPDKAVMQQVKSSLEQKIKQMQISLTGEPVLRLTGLSAATLPHMDYEVAGTPAQRKVWQDKIDQQGAELKARGLLS